MIARTNRLALLAIFAPLLGLAAVTFTGCASTNDDDSVADDDDSAGDDDDSAAE